MTLPKLRETKVRGVTEFVQRPREGKLDLVVIDVQTLLQIQVISLPQHPQDNRHGHPVERIVKRRESPQHLYLAPLKTQLLFSFPQGGVQGVSIFGVLYAAGETDVSLVAWKTSGPQGKKHGRFVAPSRAEWYEYGRMAVSGRVFAAPWFGGAEFGRLQPGDALLEVRF